MPQPALLFRPLRSAAPALGGSVDLLLRVLAPGLSGHGPVASVPRRLALVIDRSGSMRGEAIQEALRCVLHIVANLAPHDQVSVVLYDSRAEVLVPLQPVSALGSLQSLLDGVACGGSTDLFAGWQAGVSQLQAGPADAISRVILLSDGQANQGQTDERFIERSCRDWADRGVSTTTIGLGRLFNEELMIGMARGGDGQHYYGQAAQDLYDSFDEELTLLQALCLTRLRLDLVAAAGVGAEMLSPAEWMTDGRWRLPDLAWGAEAWVALRLHTDPGVTGTWRELLEVRLGAQALDGQPVQPASARLRLQLQDAPYLHCLPADDLVARRLDETAFARASLELRLLARLGDMDGVYRLLDSLELLYAHHVWLRAKLASLRRLAGEDLALMSKEVMFSSLKMTRRLSQASEAAFSVDETDSPVPAYLRRKIEEGRGRRS